MKTPWSNIGRGIVEIKNKCKKVAPVKYLKRDGKNYTKSNKYFLKTNVKMWPWSNIGRGIVRPRPFSGARLLCIALT